MDTASKRARLDYLDIAKAITIFLVMVGHAAGNFDTPYYRLVLYTFHMPLFFLVSGVVIRKHQTSGYSKEHWIVFLRKNILAIIVPYFVWGLIYSRFNYENVLRLIYGSYRTISDAETLSSLWFLPCLFLARIEMELVLMSHNLFKKVNRHTYALIISVICFVIAFLLPTLEIGYPFNFDSSVMALGFMLIGYSFKERLPELEDNKYLTHFIWLVVYLVIFIASLIIQGDNVYLVKMFYNDVGNPIYFLLSALSGIGIILTISIILSKLWKDKESRIKDITLWIGKNTIGIFLLHKPLLQQVFIANFEKLGYSSNNLWVAVLGSVITLPICCLIIMIIDKYIPQLFGKFPSEKLLVVKKESIEE